MVVTVNLYYGNLLSDLRT